MSEGEHDIRIHPGRIRSRKAPGTKSFINQVLRAAQKSGHTSGQSVAGAQPSGYGRSSFGRGRISFSRSRLFNPARRVVVKARVVRHRGRSFRSAPLTAHLSYLKREGVTRDGERASMFDANGNSADDAAFADRSKHDRHHFRFIVSPEDAGEMTDLRAFTRDLAKQMEADLGTKLDWVAVDHWNTDNPHVHLLVRGVDERGADLVIARDYISRGLRSRAEDLVAIELGPRPEHDIHNALTREIIAERWTRLDVEIRMTSDDTGLIDLRPDTARGADPEIR
ncbi:MAG: type VI secretion protein, partial [Ancalomicrobiaceae bacterium]|nr:type VI secretion protein [Ancalomicrobiaceae bacterium]